MARQKDRGRETIMSNAQHAGNSVQHPLVHRYSFPPCLIPSVDLICIATDGAKSTYTTTSHSLLAQPVSSSSDFMICAPFANHTV
jgi:hypothetical protein